MLGRSRQLAKLVRYGPSSSIRGGRCDMGADFAACADERGVGAAGWAGHRPQRFAMRLHAIWLASNDGASRWITSTSNGAPSVAFVGSWLGWACLAPVEDELALGEQPRSVHFGEGVEVAERRDHDLALAVG